MVLFCKNRKKEDPFAVFVLYLQRVNNPKPRASNFFNYFASNFENLGLKKLITASYKTNYRKLFIDKEDENAVSLEYTGDKNGNKVSKENDVLLCYVNTIPASLQTINRQTKQKPTFLVTIKIMQKNNGEFQ